MISIPEKWLFWRQMCWSFSSFVIKSGCTSKESWDCGDTMLSSGERRKKTTGTQSLKFCDKTWPVQNRRLKGFHYGVLHSLEPMSFSVVTAWALDFQNFKNCIWDLKENTRLWQELGSWTFLFLNLRIVVLVLEKRQWLSKHCHQRCYWEFGDLSFQQTLSANSGDVPSKVNYGICHFPKCLFLYHLCSFVHALFSILEYLPLLLHLSKLPFPQYPTQMLSSPWLS